MSIRCVVDAQRRRIENNRLIAFEIRRPYKLPTDGRRPAAHENYRSVRMLPTSATPCFLSSVVVVLATSADRQVGICNLLKSYGIQLRFYSGGNVRNPIAQRGGMGAPDITWISRDSCGAQWANGE